tara:strand:+ start:288 stop:464 length:177 start_codon:yes stop_codon:yes gene_type:complete
MGIPLFTTVEEALSWAAANGLSGYHVHNHQNIRGYMGGVNHATAVSNNSTPPASSGGY